VAIFGEAGPASLYNGEFFITSVGGANIFEYGPLSGLPSGAGSGAKYRVITADIHPRKLISLNRSLDSTSQKWIATAVVPSLAGSQRHDLEIGDCVLIRNAGHIDAVSFPDAGLYNGRIKVTATPDAKTFEYTIDRDPKTGTADAPASFCAGYYARIWQFGRLQFEANVIELVEQRLMSDFNRSVAFFVYVGGNAPQFTGRQLLVRDNLIRHIDNGSDPDRRTRGIEVYSTENALIARNIIQLDTAGANASPSAIESDDISGLQTFDNTDAGGTLSPAVASTKLMPEIVSGVRSVLEDAIILALLSD
jgi:hypothetical protein